jgi:hypothetical protein
MIDLGIRICQCGVMGFFGYSLCFSEAVCEAIARFLLVVERLCILHAHNQ